jgi:hypothetical protein
MQALFRFFRENPWLALQAGLVVIQLIAVYIVATSTAGATRVVVISTLAVTVATAIRELIREARSPHTKSGRAVARNAHLLDFLNDRLPQLTSTLTTVLAGPPDQQASARTNLDHQVVTEAARLVAGERVRAALVWRDANRLIVDPYRSGWQTDPVVPVSGSPEFHLLRLTLDDPECATSLWVTDRKEERSIRALAFGFGENARSWVACPIRCSDGVIGFLHLETDTKDVFAEREAAVLTVLSSLLGAVHGPGRPAVTTPRGEA